MADALRGHEELNVVAVPDERHSHHQDLERNHGNRPHKKTNNKKTHLSAETDQAAEHICFGTCAVQFRTLRVEEYRLALRNLEQHYQDFLRDSQDSQMFGAEDRMQVESNYNGANRHYNTMVSSAEQGGRRRLLYSVPHSDNISLCHQRRTLIRSTSRSIAHEMFELNVTFLLQARRHPGQVRGFLSGARCVVEASDWLVVVLSRVSSRRPTRSPFFDCDSLTSLDVALLVLCMEINAS